MSKVKYRISMYGDLYKAERSYKQIKGWLWWKRETWSKWHGLGFFGTYTSAYNHILDKYL
jgi:hypothetical protein